MVEIKQFIQDVERFDEILLILLEEGFHEFLYKSQLHLRIPFIHRIKHHIKKIKKSESEPVRIRRAFQKLGPTFIKLGQVLSVRPDLLPKDYIEEFKKLQENNIPVEFEEIKEIIEEKLIQLSVH
jgi:ubiquinone biosynthesis protein